MRVELLETLRCPVTGKRLELIDPVANDDGVESGLLTTEDGRQYPIEGGIPRFVPNDNYASSFGFQWNKFSRTQLDSHSGTDISSDRFYRSTEWSPDELRGKRVLEVGCGAGRFTEVLLATGATVIALDYSSAVDACWANHHGHPNLSVVQADLYHLPFCKGTFDFVLCLGVLQHLPDVKRAFMSLVPPLAKGGDLVVDVYRKWFGTIFWSKYWVRPFTRGREPGRLFELVQAWVPVLLPLSKVLGRVPFAGRKLRYLIPVVNYEGVFPLTPTQIREWAVLDTFDMLAPKYDRPQSAATLYSWFEEAGMTDIKVFRPAHLVGQGRRSSIVRCR